MRATRCLLFCIVGLIAGCESRLNDDSKSLIVTVRISIGPSRAQANSDSVNPVFSDNGRFIVYQSRASNLVTTPAVTAGRSHIYLYDRQTSLTALISINTAGTELNGDSFDPSISANGNLVAFETLATNHKTVAGAYLGDANSASDVLVRDRLGATTTLISINSLGSGTGDGPSTNPSISGDGTTVALQSDATDLILDDTNGVTDIFVGASTEPVGMTRVSIEDPGNPDGNPLDLDNANAPSRNPSISNDGTLVVFESDAPDLLAALDASAFTDIFMRDVLAATTSRISVDSVGGEPDGDSINPVISLDGSVVAFRSVATNLGTIDTNPDPDVFVRVIAPPSTELVSLGSSGLPANGDADFPAVSTDGRFVAFQSSASTLVGGDTNSAQDIFVRDRTGGTTTRVSNLTFGGQGNADSTRPSISGDGVRVAFQSDATNLADDDTNGATDIFEHGPFP